MIMKIPPGMNAALEQEKMAVSDVTKNLIEDLGPSESMLGYATRHYRITRAGTLITTNGAANPAPARWTKPRSSGSPWIQPPKLKWTRLSGV